MHLTNVYAITALGLAAMANARKGEANIFGCVWHSAKPVKAYQVNWSPGGSDVKCMRLTGHPASMKVTNQGLTCTPLGKVVVNNSGVCIFRQSWWGLSYLAEGAPYSGSTNSRWTTGPANSDVTLHDYSAGTNVCSRKAHCKRTFVEWDNDTNADLYLVFQPGSAGKSASEGDEEVMEFEEGEIAEEHVMEQQQL